MFFIVEAGHRIQTPVESLFRNREVNAVSATAPVRPVDARESAVQANRKKLERSYREGEQQVLRHRVKFAHEIMTSPVVTGRVKQTLDDIWRIFAEHGVHHLPLLDDDDRLQGIVSDRDIMRFAANASRWSGRTAINTLMSSKVITAAPETEVRELAEVMVRRGIGSIPVMNNTTDLTGIVSRTDILRTLVHRAPLELWS